MKEESVIISLDRDLLKEMDGLVKQGLYRDRQEVVRIALAEKLYHLKQARNPSVHSSSSDEQSDWPDYLEDKFGGSSV
jgi:Arc/MetJ-type ribon-helix-helix transcriptional regulator